ncbi:MAG: hypothetical protein H7X70_04405 [Candidatus Kapabacteria bacterium]|nr:hypothetical protein [Candidatus Kapabacteria bacterium]
MPLLIAQRAPAGQPIRFLAGDSGSVRALEIDAAGTTWIRGPLSIGQLVGANFNEQIRVGSVQPIGGKAIVVSLLGTSTSTGLLVRDIGVSGVDEAGIVLQSTSNGIGTGIRIGGPSGMLRPTLSTGIDITGGTGIRYNALTSGSGTALEIGGTIAPRRGIEIVATGTSHIGLLALANTNGAGVIGVSQSSSYTTVPSTERIGVRGHAATNSTTIGDTIIGTMGSSVRGGSGGTLTTSIGIVGQSASSGTSHAGTSVGVLGRATALAPGRAVAMGGCFISDTMNLSLCALGGDIYLGSSDEERPPQLAQSTFAGHDGRTRTHVYDLVASGIIGVSMFSLKGATRIVLGAGTVDDLPTDLVTVLRVDADVTTTTLSGCAGVMRGRTLIIVVTAGTLRLGHEHAGSQGEHRFHLSGNNDVLIDTDESVFLWYDEEIARWRILGS